MPPTSSVSPLTPSPVQPSASQVPPPSSLPMLTGPTQLFKQAWSFYLGHWTPLASIVAVSFAISLVIQILSRTSLLSILAAFLLNIVNLITQLALITYVSKGGQVTVGSSFNRGISLFLPLIWLVILLWLISLGGFILFVIPVIALSGWLMFSLYVLAAEDLRGFKAILRSWFLTSGYWWAVLGRSLFFSLICAIGFLVLLLLSFILSAAFGDPRIFQIILGLVSSFLFAPLSVAYLSLIYRDLKAIKGETDFSAAGLQTKRKWLIAFIVIGVIVLVGIIFLFGAILVFFGSQLLHLYSTQSVPLQLPNNPTLGPAGISFISLAPWIK